MAKLCNYLNIHANGINQSIETVNLSDDKNYSDPDATSLELYQALQRIFQNRHFPNGYYISETKITRAYHNYGLRWLIKNQATQTVLVMNMGADYFGISRKWVKLLAGFSDGDVRDMLRMARLIGGHMIFPRNIQNLLSDEHTGGLPSVNTNRGGRPMYDRTDLFLLDLANYYVGQPYRTKAILKFRDFFDLFQSFKGFIDFFDLGVFVNQKYEVVNLQLNEPFPEKSNLLDNSQLLCFPTTKEMAQQLVDHSNSRIYERSLILSHQMLADS